MNASYVNPLSVKNSMLIRRHYFELKVVILNMPKAYIQVPQCTAAA